MKPRDKSHYGHSCLGEICVNQIYCVHPRDTGDSLGKSLVGLNPCDHCAVDQRVRYELVLS